MAVTASHQSLRPSTFSGCCLTTLSDRVASSSFATHSYPIFELIVTGWLRNDFLSPRWSDRFGCSKRIMIIKLHIYAIVTYESTAHVYEIDAFCSCALQLLLDQGQLVLNGFRWIRINRPSHVGGGDAVRIRNAILGIDYHIITLSERVFRSNLAHLVWAYFL